MTNEQLDELRGLAYKLDAAKRAESDAKKDRIELEEAIAAMVEGPEKGQKTVALPGKGKVTVERGFNYRADAKTILESWDRDDLPPPIKTTTTRKLDEAGYEWYRQNHADLYKLIAAHVSVMPKKVAVSVKGL